MNKDLELLRRLLRAKDHMDRAPHQVWSVARLASVSGTSEAHFARSFRQAFDTPPHRYLLTRRVERAASLLRDTEMAVTDIAMQVGWESIGTFGRTFRDIIGESPTGMRRRLRAEAGSLNLVPPAS
jgi:transcriptional regulator GlxA family with amidase domain